MQAYANEFRKKKILKKIKKLKEKKEIYSYKKVRSEREGTSHKNHEKNRFISLANSSQLPLSLEFLFHLDLMYINSQASFPNTA